MLWRTPSSSDTLRIRRARKRDEAALSAIWWRAVQQDHGFLGFALLAEERRALTEMYLPSCEVWLAQDVRPLGFVALHAQGEVAGLFVDPVAQGQGIGRRLLDHIRGDKDLHLEVAAPNLSARLFYQKYGFRELSRRHDPNLDETLVQLHLPATKERHDNG